MRLAWTLFSVLIALTAVALYMVSPIDPLRWGGEAAFGAGSLSLSAAVPVARLAEAVIAGLVVAQMLVLLPLSADAWADGGRRLAVAHHIADAPPDESPDSAAIEDGAVTTWQPLLSLFAGQMSGRDASQSVSGLAAAGLSAAVDGIVANQSGAGVFRSFPVLTLGLGLIALAAQILPALAVGAADNPALFGAAAARGLCSLAAATAAAAVLALVSRLVAAALRHRAERLGAALERAGRRRRAAPQQQSAELVAVPLARGGEAVVDAGPARVWPVPGPPARDTAESVEAAIREVHASTLKPMLHDISRLLSLLGERATHLVGSVDDRLKQQSEQTRQILAATGEIARLLSAYSERAGNGAAGGESGALQELRQALGESKDAQVVALRGVGQDLATQLDTVLRGAMRSMARPVSMQTEALRKAVEQIGTATEAMTRVGVAFEQSSATIGQRLDRLIEVQAGDRGGSEAAAGQELRAAAADIAAFAQSGRVALQSLAGLSGQARPGMAAAAATTASDDEVASSWAQRVGALQRAARDLTSGLPPLAVGKPD